MNDLDHQSAVAMWSEFIARFPEHATEGQPPLERFGDSAEMAEELLDLVLHGPKRATAAAVVEFRAEKEPLPRIGSHWIAADVDGQARAIIRTRELRIGPLGSVDEAFAWDEGEGERTRSWWVDAHLKYFGRSCAQLGLEVNEHLELVFERFEVVWPPELAD